VERGATELLERLTTLVDGVGRTEVVAGVRGLWRLVDELDAKSGYPTDHARAVAVHAAAVARRLGLGGRELIAVEVGAALHDLGKLCIRESVLTKPGPLTEQEWDVMRLHPAAGARAFSALVTAPDVAAIVRWHHERWDGSGYPDGLRREAIPLGARIVAVADAYQAMLEARPYRPPLDAASARACVWSGAGTEFDPACVEAFDASLGSAAA
jgi:HD-GYP domain-containing protein (c-di-GMP phosphodiesterase class II)